MFNIRFSQNDLYHNFFQISIVDLRYIGCIIHLLINFPNTLLIIIDFGPAKESRRKILNRESSGVPCNHNDARRCHIHNNCI